ncbi:Na(+)/H(+) exchange regulatory cofactor NHE-RF3-like [Carcharodon carcharias]|uniref:Na(+)/H(+) exchange regulatory cofactor NHE-RF3-like n=1 Tax=Carcharodon carcharias TaxID=13397 RepID=UPI001B7DFDEB|nr:Na(+)/H(+) exchange regulatory cofactor NHE-RF3-like [Carcharodon carcharias]
MKEHNGWREMNNTEAKENLMQPFYLDATGHPSFKAMVVRKGECTLLRRSSRHLAPGVEDRAALSPKFTFNPKEGIDNPALVICDDLELPISLKPRICVLTKKDNEMFGFHLRAEKGRPGHIIRHVEPGNCAQYAGLSDADRVLEVNGEYVDNIEHFKLINTEMANTSFPGRILMITESALSCYLFLRHELGFEPFLSHVVHEESSIQIALPDSRSEFTEDHTAKELVPSRIESQLRPILQSQLKVNFPPELEVSTEAVPESLVLLKLENSVVEKIRLSGSKITFLVVNGAAYEDAKMKNLNIAELIQSDNQTLCGKPRLCYVEKGPNGFGFELFSSEGAMAPFTLSIQSEGPAEKSGVQSDDRLIEINGVNVEDCTYLQVKKEIKETGDSVTLLVTDQKTDAYYRDKGIRIVPAMACFKHVPFKPRKLYLVKGSCGYGFLLKTEKTISGTYGQYLREVDAGSPAEKCGMKEGDRLLAVNRDNIEGLQHDIVVRKIRESGNQTTFTVISSEGEKYFTSLGLSPLICMDDDDVEEQMELKETAERRLSPLQAHPPLCCPTAQQATGPKPRLCHLVKSSSGYGFQIYSITDEPGVYIQEVVPEDVGYKAGIRDGDMVIEVNGINIEKVSYEDVLLKIKEKISEVTLLVMNKNEYWHCKDNDIPISRESAGEDNKTSKTGSTEKGIVSNTDSSKKTNKTTAKDSNAHLVNKVTSTGPLPSENLF